MRSNHRSRCREIWRRWPRTWRATSERPPRSRRLTRSIPADHRPLVGHCFSFQQEKRLARSSFINRRPEIQSVAYRRRIGNAPKAFFSFLTFVVGREGTVGRAAQCRSPHGAAMGTALHLGRETTFDVSLETQIDRRALRGVRSRDRRALAEWTRPRFARNLIDPRISAFDEFH